MLFNSFVNNLDGVLSRGELTKALVNTGLDPEDVEQLFTEFDDDGNALIDSSEFEKLMLSTNMYT